MRRFLLTVLALGGVVCALVVTASSTMTQARQAGMPEPVPLFLVGLLEVVNIAGTWTWVTDGRAQMRTEAAIAVGVASLVTGVCGGLTYGPLGLVAPVGLLAAVHLVSRMWTLPAQAPEAAQPEFAQVTWEPTPHPLDPVSPPAQDEPPTEVIEVQPDPPAPVGDEPQPVAPPSQPESDDELLPRLRAWVRQDGRMPGRDAVKREFGIGTARAERLREQAQRPELTAVKEA